MSEYENDIRRHFGLPLEGNMCDKCKSKLEDKFLIDKVLELNASAQTSLGTDATETDKYNAYSAAIYAKATIMSLDPKFAEVCFPEIDLNTPLSPEDYLGEKL